MMDGDFTHMALIDQMSVETVYCPAMIGPDLSAACDDLRRFRHLLHHSCGIDLRPADVREKFNLITSTVWPAVLESLENLRRHLEGEFEPGETDAGSSRSPSHRL